MMSSRFLVVALTLLALANSAHAQPANRRTETAWRPVGDSGPAARTASLDRDRNIAPGVLPAETTSVARVTKGSGTLPNDHGQVWREYDISPYTVRVTTTKRPEQAIVDWILLETGYEVWHSEPLGILSATSRKLRVYHTPEMQKVVSRIVDRFVANQQAPTSFSLRVFSVDHPNWRGRAQQLMRPVKVETPGVNAWVMQKEDAAILLRELERRTDYRAYSSPHMKITNGQPTVVSSKREIPYVRNVTADARAQLGYQVQQGVIGEGFALEFSPLLSVDRGTVYAMLKCDIDQVEKMLPVMIDVPTTLSPRQRTEIQVPQLTQSRFQERFSWPSEQVMLVDLGMAALPIPVDGRPLVPGLKPLGTTPRRANMLVMIEAKGVAASQSSGTTHTPHTAAQSYRGRY